MVHAPFRWQPIGEYLDGNGFVAFQLYDDPISRLENDLVQIFLQDHVECAQYVDWLLDQIEGTSDDDNEEHEL